MLRTLLTIILLGGQYVIPNEYIRGTLTPLMKNVGIALTLGMSKNPTIGPFWNKTIEPVFVDLIDNVCYSVQNGLVAGLRSDNLTKDDNLNNVPESLPRSETSEGNPK